MEMLNMSKAMRTEVINGKVYFDLEQLLEIMYDVCNEASVMATNHRDPVLGTMTLGMANMCKALDGVLTLQKEANGLTVQKGT